MTEAVRPVVLATGGTACAAIDLVRRTGADIVRFEVIMDLPSLGGAQRVRERGVSWRCPSCGTACKMPRCTTASPVWNTVPS